MIVRIVKFIKTKKKSIKEKLLALGNMDFTQTYTFYFNFAKDLKSS